MRSNDTLVTFMLISVLSMFLKLSMLPPWGGVCWGGGGVTGFCLVAKWGGGGKRIHV